MSARNDDCDDTNPDISPEEPELIADGIDSNCDEIELCFEDLDGDGFGHETIESSDLSCSSAGLATVDADCNDQDDSIFPTAQEAAGDSIDQNCDGFEDCYEDLDEDGYRTEEIVETVNIDCSGATESLMGILEIDCDDTSAQTYPGAAFNESQTCMLDGDGDGYGSSSVTGTVQPGGDCNDANSQISPAAVEVCDGIDNDCDTLIGEDDPSLDTTTASMYYDDQDGDGYGGSIGDHYCIQPSGFVNNDDDCNDNDSSINPSTIWYIDADGDDYGSSSSTLTQCNQPTGYVQDNTDCDDLESTTYPTATEISGDGVDQDCDNLELCYEDLDNDGYRTGNTNLSVNIDCSGADEALTSVGLLDCDDSSAQTFPGAGFNEILPNLCRLDGDGDGYGNSSALSSVTVGTDCDDSDADISPAAVEVCDGGVDNDCDTLIDEADSSLDVSTASLLYADLDEDGYGDPSQSAYYCNLAAGLVSNGDDCDDSNDALNPNTVWYADDDGDGFGVSSDTLVQCVQISGYVLTGGDCNDASISINPNATEVVGDGVDQDCDTNEICYQDSDNDGFRTSAEVASSDTDCNDSGEALASASIDCADSNFSINPDATEVCDGDDNDCDSLIDEADNSLDTSTATLYYLDGDGDGFGRIGFSDYFCSPSSGWVTNLLDCNDSQSTINPNATELPADGVDQDCNNRELCYEDLDDDGFGSTTESESTIFDYTCSAQYRSNFSNDCDDDDDNINPLASDNVGNGVDENCDLLDGVDDDGDGFASQASGGEDCDDGNGSAYPLAEEFPGVIDLNCDGFESIDNNCYGVTEFGVYYLYCETEVTWSTARERCEDHGYEMVSIRSADENDTVWNMISDNTWLGYKDMNSDSGNCHEYLGYEWTDGYTGYYDFEDYCWPWADYSSSGGYNNWSSGQPNNHDDDQDCARIQIESGNWYDDDCSDPRHYLCTIR